MANKTSVGQLGFLQDSTCFGICKQTIASTQEKRITVATNEALLRNTSVGQSYHSIQGRPSRNTTSRYCCQATQSNALLGFPRPRIRHPLDVLFLVEVRGFEPPASASRTQRSTKLSHTSIFNVDNKWSQQADLNR